MKTLYSQSLLAHELKLPIKKDKIFHRYKILYLTSGCYMGKIFFANASKIIRNWFLTLQPDIFQIICNLPKWAQERA